MTDKLSDNELKDWAKWILHKTRDGDVAAMLGHGVQGVARRLLELLPPADDVEPVTVEWLKGVGFVSAGKRNPRLWLESLECATDGLNWCYGGVCLPNDPTTRGHVRRLCAALGITLQETKS